MANNNGKIYCLDTMILSYAFLHQGSRPEEIQKIEWTKYFIENLILSDSLATTDINIAEFLKAADSEERQKELYKFITEKFIIIPFNSLAARDVAILFRSLYGKYPKNDLKNIQLKDDLKILASVKTSMKLLYPDICIISEDNRMLEIGNNYGIPSHKIPEPPQEHPDLL